MSVLSIYISYVIFINFEEKKFHLGFPLCNAKTKLQHAVVALLWLLWSCQNSLKVNIYVTKSGPKKYSTDIFVSIPCKITTILEYEAIDISPKIKKCYTKKCIFVLKGNRKEPY